MNLIAENDPLVMCYPFGAYNSESITILKELNIDLAFTTKSGSAYLNKTRLELNRWDTNDCWSKEWCKPVLPSMFHN